MEVTLNGYQNFRGELSEVLVNTSKSCTLVINTYLRGMDNNYKQTETMETESMEHRQD